MKRSVLPFLGDALRWLTGTATTKVVNAIKSRVNQLIFIQQNQQETLVHVVLILKVTRYATQVNRQHINILVDAMEKTHQDITTLHSYHTFFLKQHQLPSKHTTPHIHLANLLDSLHYMWEIALQTMDYIDAATTGILSPPILPVQDPNPRWTFPLINRCANKGWCTANRNIRSIQLGYTPWKLLIMLWHRKQVFGNNTWWNQHNWDFRQSIQHI